MTILYENATQIILLNSIPPEKFHEPTLIFDIEYWRIYKSLNRSDFYTITIKQKLSRDQGLQS